MYKLCNTINVVCSEKKIDYSNVRKCIYIFFIYILQKSKCQKTLFTNIFFLFIFSARMMKKRCVLYESQVCFQKHIASCEHEF